MKVVSIRQALQNVVDNPELDTDAIITLPVHELVARTLFELANSPTATDRASLSRANVARKMIFDRLVGKRRPGSHPATRHELQIEFADLAGELGK